MSNTNVHLALLKVEIDALIGKLDYCMQQIKKLDEFINDTDNEPDEAAMAVHVMTDKAHKFETLVEEIRDKLNIYITEQKKLNVPVDFSYVKLLNQILKG